MKESCHPSRRPFTRYRRGIVAFEEARDITRCELKVAFSRRCAADSVKLLAALLVSNGKNEETTVHICPRARARARVMLRADQTFSTKQRKVFRTRSARIWRADSRYDKLVRGRKPDELDRAISSIESGFGFQ